jgi:beta-aspartyl-peptidase (threonine type)
MRCPALIVHGGIGRADAPLAADVVAGCAAAAEDGWAVLLSDGAAVDAVVAAVANMEDAPLFNAGVGSCLTAAGCVEMDASIMDGATGRGAGVGVVRTARNPIRLARAVLLDGRHVLLAGSGADAFARAAGLPIAEPESFVTPSQRTRWQTHAPASGGTVGAVAIDRRGHVAAATSTGGVLGKLPGRIGDSAVIGAGTYADDEGGAASATGHGETIMLAGLAKAAVDGLRGGRHPQPVAAACVHAAAARSGSAVGLIVVDRFGRIGWAEHGGRMPIAVCPPRG